jgi:hypothetical protein
MIKLSMYMRTETQVGTARLLYILVLSRVHGAGLTASEQRRVQ